MNYNRLQLINSTKGDYCYNFVKLAKSHRCHEQCDVGKIIITAWITQTNTHRNKKERQQTWSFIWFTLGAREEVGTAGKNIGHIEANEANTVS